MAVSLAPLAGRGWPPQRGGRVRGRSGQAQRVEQQTLASPDSGADPVRALKILVVVMGVMIVAGVAVLIVVIAGRVSRGGPGTPSPTPFAASPIELPKGARIETMSTGSDRLVIDLVLPDGNRQLVIIDLATGRSLGTIPLRTAP